MRATWLGVFVRAVVIPAARRASSAWLGCAVIAGLAFGKNGVSPRDVTLLAQNNLAIGAALAVTWGLIYLPAARVLVRADGAVYLRALPAPRITPLVVGGVALVGLQLPWLALWTIGAGLRGLAIVVGLTVLVAAVAAWRPRLPARAPAWRSPLGALAGIHLRALGRRAGDALLRGAGFALLAGAVAGLFVRNNGLAGQAAAVMAASVLAIVLVPAQVGPLVTLDESHRATRWLASTARTRPRSVHTLNRACGSRTAARTRVPCRAISDTSIGRVPPGPSIGVPPRSSCTRPGTRNDTRSDGASAAIGSTTGASATAARGAAAGAAGGVATGVGPAPQATRAARIGHVFIARR